MNIGFVCLLECVSNVVLSFVYVITAPWKFGFFLCRLSSFLMELVPIVYTLLLLSLLVDRVRRDFCRENKVSKKCFCHLNLVQYCLAFQNRSLQVSISRLLLFETRSGTRSPATPAGRS